MSQELEVADSNGFGPYEEERIVAKRKGNSLRLALLLVLTIFVAALAAYEIVAWQHRESTLDELALLSPATVDFEDARGDTGNIIEKSESSSYRQVNDILSFAPLRSGEIHFARIPREYWEHRLQMIKGLGLNAVGVYVFWNHHEIEKGVFDFAKGERDLVGFLELAQKHGLKVLLRPGPYVCAEWDFGGLPARLLEHSSLTIRASNAAYEAEVYTYFKALSEVIKPYLNINGGSIILLQIQNEFGSYNRDYQHTFNLLQMWRNLGVQCNFYYEDAYVNWMKHYWPGASFGLSEGHHLKQFRSLELSQYFRNRMVFGGEVYTGWLTHWGEKWNGLQIKDFQTNFKGLLEGNKSFNLYVIHGGTNFGLSAGANDFKDRKYTAHVTSYDYDAPINEQGRPAEKYQVIRSLMKNYASAPQVPQPIKTIAISQISLQLQAHLLQNLPKVQSIGKLTYFESSQIRMYHQGIVVYQTILPQKGLYPISLIVHDFAIFFLDGKKVGTLVRQKFERRSFNINCRQSKCVLRILVEAMGHVNYGELQPLDKKGLLVFQVPSRQQLSFEWNIYRIPLNDTAALDWKGTAEGGPKLLKGSFDLAELGDTFIDMKDFTKGYVWVNNRLLGRYWNIGPQQRLFCPGVWLKNKQNQIHILELLQADSLLVSSKQTLA